MERTKLVGVLALVGAVATLGCGDSGGDGGSGGSAGTGGVGGSVPTVMVEVTVIEFQPGEANIAVEGAEVCVLDSSNCASTDAEGLATLEAPANSDTGFAVLAEDYTPTIAPLTTGNENTIALTAILTDALTTTLAALIDTPYPPEGTGLVALSVVVAPASDDENGIAGVTFSSDRPATSYYLDENEFPSLVLTETTAPSGAGGYIELAPGTWEITLGGTAANCVIVAGWPGGGANSVRFPIQVGFFTQAIVTCDPP